VAQSVISELLTRVGPAPVQQVLPEPTDAESESVQPSTVEPVAVEPDGEEADGEAADGEAADGEEVARAAFAGSARIATGAYRCRYAAIRGETRPRTHRAANHDRFGRWDRDPQEVRRLL